MNPRSSLSGLDSAFLALDPGDIALGFGAAVGELLKGALEKTSEGSPVGGEGPKLDPDLASAEAN